MLIYSIFGENTFLRGNEDTENVACEDLMNVDREKKKESGYFDRFLFSFTAR